MNNKTLALLLVIVAATGFNAQAAKKNNNGGKKNTTNNETTQNDTTAPAKTTCMQELNKGKGVASSMNASVKCQERAIGRLALSGVLAGDELASVMNKQKEFDAALTAATKDKKISAEEKKNLQALKKAATSAVFESSWDEGAVDLRLKKLEDRLYGAETAGQLTASEMVLLKPELDEMKALAEKLKAGGLTTAEKKKMREQMKLLNQKILDDRMDDEGNVFVKPDRDKDHIDELRRQQAANVVSCFSDGKNTSNYGDQFAQLKTVLSKEAQYVKSEGGLSAEEISDLDMLYKKAGMDFSSTCGVPKNLPKPKKSDLAPTTTANPSLEVEFGIADPQGPKSDVPADPSKKVGSGL